MRTVVRVGKPNFCDCTATIYLLLMLLAIFLQNWNLRHHYYVHSTVLICIQKRLKVPFTIGRKPSRCNSSLEETYSSISRLYGALICFDQ